MGVVATVTTSDGVHLHMPKLLSPGEAQRKRRLQRKLARQTKGSNRRARTKLQLAKLSTREADRRRDWIEKTTTTLVRSFDFIAIEDLKVKEMVRSARGTVENPGKNVLEGWPASFDPGPSLVPIPPAPHRQGGLRRKPSNSSGSASSRHVLYLSRVRERLEKEPQEPSGL